MFDRKTPTVEHLVAGGLIEEVVNGDDKQQLTGVESFIIVIILVWHVAILQVLQILVPGGGGDGGSKGMLSSSHG
eukprot:scaffold417814_cov62-Attheya_sp.AAC.2